MRGVNKAIIVGTVVKDPSVRQSKDGKGVANFSIVTNYGEVAQFHDCVAFGAVVDNFISKYIYKGSRVYIEGRLQNSDYDKQFDCGQKHRVYKTQVVVITIELVYNPETVEATKEDLEGSESFADTNFDDDIPF
jgi:single-strand DNA-binding protein|tara:strand:- start:1650 stop:2051 length:402 start_codon:yes stop_codon:yes gene_type:complete